MDLQNPISESPAKSYRRLTLVFSRQLQSFKVLPVYNNMMSIRCLKLNALQLLAIFLLSFLILNALAHDEINSETISSDTLNPSSNINGLDVYSESPQLTRVVRQRRPILTGAAVAVVVANNRRPYYASNYYYPTSGYSNGCNCNG
ncbi:hypothetical protein DAPPUDRAFT_98064 [Daphnia pulex]|uniref:Uncharacterized protein n=1 Tax=Daphnia pulex TaxID=6669 RepID=E9G277_DAPPU|nr:hypothetical protein DAPPUDRAFT_98064 [Daphnia pulex]|eukprot:EFX86196.1 hypothetical protein DAPPUDRAFT_98064 [Daphnia pulex]